MIHILGYRPTAVFRYHSKDIVIQTAVSNSTPARKGPIGDKPNPTQNHIRGQIELLEGFDSQSVKVAINDDENWNELMDVVWNILIGKEEGRAGTVDYKKWIRLLCFAKSEPKEKSLGLRTKTLQKILI